MYFRACAHYDNDNLNAALADLDAALELNYNDLEISLKIGEIHNDEGRYQEAALHYRRALDLAEDGETKSEILRSLGYVLVNDGKPHEAVAIAMELLRMGNVTEGLLLRGDARLSMGDIRGAENDCNLARVTDQGNGTAIYLMQRILTARGRPREAKKLEAELGELLAA